eukprot:3028019-Ditylum_brightwellii.AAC.1
MGHHLKPYQALQKVLIGRNSLPKLLLLKNHRVGFQHMHSLSLVMAITMCHRNLILVLCRSVKASLENLALRLHQHMGAMNFKELHMK